MVAFAFGVADEAAASGNPTWSAWAVVVISSAGAGGGGWVSAVDMLGGVNEDDGGR